MNYINYILFAFVLLSISCKQQNGGKEGIPTINLKESKDILPISSFVDKLDYLELKLAGIGVEIGEILNVKLLDDDLIILQRRAKEITFLRFDQEGNFLNEIVNNHKGRGGIANPLDIINYKKDYAVLDEDGIHVVGKNGKYKTRLINSKMPGTRFFNLKNHFYVVNEIPGEGLYSVFTPKKKTVPIIFPEDRIRKMGASNVIYAGSGKVRFFSSYSDSVYFFSDKGLTPLYTVESDGYPSFAEVMQNNGDRNATETLKYIHNTQHSKIKTYLENERFLFISYWLGSHSSTVIINKPDWETLYFSQAVNNIDGGIWDRAMFLSDNSELFIPISAYKISRHKISDKKHHEFEEVQQRIAYSGNPVIMRCKLR